MSVIFCLLISTLVQIGVPSGLSTGEKIDKLMNEHDLHRNRLISLEAEVKEKEVLLNWQMNNIDSVVNFQISRSLDGFHYYTLKTQKISSFKKEGNQFRFVDVGMANLTIPILYYQVQAILASGKVIQSSPIRIVSKQLQPFQFFVTPYPNEELFFVQYLLKDKMTEYEFTILNGMGEIMYQRVFASAPEGYNFPIATEGWQEGPYYIQAKSKDVVITHKYWVKS